MTARPGVADAYPLSPMQEGMLFHTLEAPAGGAYVIQVTGLLDDLDEAAFERAWERVIERHAALRTAFAWDRGERPLQVVGARVRLPLRREDWSNSGEEERGRRLDELLEAERRRGFDPARAPLMRIVLARLDGGRRRFVWTVHHLLVDGWSIALLLAELAACYAAFAAGREPELPAVRPYRDFVAWLRRRDPAAADEAWRRALAGFRAPTPLPWLDPGAGEAPSGEPYRRRTVRLPRAATARLAETARRHGLTLFTVVQGAWALLLARSSGERDVVFGVATAGRPPSLAGSESMVGLFINTVPARVRVAPERPAAEWLRAMQDELAALRDVEHAPLARVRRLSELPPDAPLFASLLVFESYPAAPESAAAGLGLHGVRSVEQTNYPLNLVAAPGEELTLLLGWDPGRCPGTGPARALGHLAALLEQIAETPGRPAGSFHLLTGAERHQVVVEWNDSAAPVPAVAFDGLLAGRAAAFADATAAVQGAVHLSHGELLRRAGELAGRLRGLGVGPEVPVAVCLERTPVLLVAVCGVLAAGGAYLLLDPDHPAERLRELLDDSRARAVVTDGASAARLPAGEPARVVLDRGARPLPGGAPSPLPAAEPPADPFPDRLAYLNYTSGSSGRPKAVMVGHRGVVNLALELARRYRLRPGDRQLQFVAPSFDAFGEELFATLIAGAAMVFLEDRLAHSPAGLLAECGRLEVTKADLPASFWHQVVDDLAAAGARVPASLRLLVTGAESPSAERLAAWSARLAGAQRFFNAYGPTEATITASMHEFELPLPAGSLPAHLPVGRPFTNVGLHVVDADGHPAPAGVPGELLIGGIGVARGYAGQPGLTAARFVPDPFAAAPGARLYRTGDHARRLPGGELEFLGRRDRQLKIAGRRVEPAEVEEALRRHPRVAAAAAGARDLGGGPRLVAWYTARGAAPGEADLRAFLAERLPAHLVPARLVALDALPLTAHGKLDREALPDPAPEAAAAAGAEGARGDSEAALLAIWQELLRRDDFGVHDNFFALGGDSILSLQIASRAQRAGLAVTPRLVFEHQTVASLAAAAAPAAAGAPEPPVSGPVPLTPIQRWYLDPDPPDPHHFVQAVLLTLGGRPPASALAGAVAALLEHHDALRLRCRRDPEGWVQWIEPPGLLPGAPPALPWCDLAALPSGSRAAALSAACARLQRRLDLGRGPMFLAARFDLGGSERLFLAAHHLAVDGVSWRVLLEDLEGACRALAAGRAPALPPRTTSFQAWARRLVEHAAAPETAAELDFWLAAAAPAVPPPVDFDRVFEPGEDLAGAARTVTAGLDAAATAELLRRAPADFKAEVEELLLTALAEAWNRWSGAAAVTVELEGHGREELFPDADLSRTVGWFTAAYPLTLDAAPGAAPETADPDAATAARLRAVKEQLRAVPRRGVGYGLLRRLSPLPGAAALARRPEPPIAFNYLGQLDAALPAGGLLSPAPEAIGAGRSPRQRRRHLFEINARIAGGRLGATFTYSARRHRRETVEALAEGFADALRRLLALDAAAAARAWSARDFPLAGLSGRRFDAVRALAAEAGGGAPLEDLYPAAPAQEGILFHARLAPGTGVYVLQFGCEIAGALDAAAFRAAWARAVLRHPALRTGFLWQGLERPLQAVYRGLAPPFEVADWSGLGEPERARRLEETAAAERAAGFDPARPPLMRLRLTRLGPGRHHFLWTLHHLVLDGWSVTLVFRDVLEIYRAAVAGREPALPAAPPFRRYLAWVAGRDPRQAERWWRRELAGFGAAHALPFDRPPGVPAAAERALRLDARRSDALRRRAAEWRLTAATLAHAAWALALARLAGDREALFGTAVSGRPADLDGAEAMVGMFINTLPVRLATPAGARLRPWLAAAQERLGELSRFEHVPLADVQRWSELPRGASLFDTLVVFENYPVDRALAAGGDLGFGAVSARESTHYPLTLRVGPGAEISLHLLYRADAFDATTAERLLRRVAGLLDALAGAGEEARLGALSGWPEAERHQVVAEWGWGGPLRGAGAEEFGRRAASAFERRAAETPDAVAVAAGGGGCELRRAAGEVGAGGVRAAAAGGGRGGTGGAGG